MRYILAFLLLFFTTQAHSSILQTIKDYSEANLSHTSGNNSVQTVGLKNQLLFQSGFMKIVSGIDFLYARAEGIDTVERYTADIEASRILWRNIDRYTSYKWLRDRLSGIRVQHNFNTGVSIHLFQRRRIHNMRIDTGFLYRYEDRLKDEIKQSPMAQIRCLYGYNIDENKEILNIYTTNFDLIDSRNVEVMNEISLKIKLTKMLSLRNSYEVRYRNDPAGNFANTDHSLRVGVVAEWR